MSAVTGLQTAIRDASAVPAEINFKIIFLLESSHFILVRPYSCTGTSSAPVIRVINLESASNVSTESTEG